MLFFFFVFNFLTCLKTSTDVYVQMYIYINEQSKKADSPVELREVFNSDKCELKEQTRNTRDTSYFMKRGNTSLLS